MLLCAKTLLNETAKIWLDAKSTINIMGIQERFGKSFNNATVHQMLLRREQSYQDYILHMKAISTQGDIEEEALI